MSPEVLSASGAGDAEPLQQWAAIGLPVPPAWEVQRDWLLAQTAESLTSALAGLATQGEQRYWLLRQGPMNPTSLRESLVNLDSDAALASALRQLFSQPEAPQRVVIQSLPGRRAAGVLFTRHPVRQDLDHRVVEGVAEDGDGVQERIILHRDGRVAYHSGAHSRLVDAPGAEAFTRLADQLSHAFDRPQACEWIYDGEQLWLVQTLPVGSLPEPREAWSRRAGFGIWHQAATPLWYTLSGRWMKAGFWRPLGQRLGWSDLVNVEPYRRQHSHIYANSQFFRRLLGEVDSPLLREALPPAWRPATAPSPSRPGWHLDGLRPWLAGLRLGSLERRYRLLREKTVDAEDQAGVWQHFMQFDRIGERLAALEGWLAHVAVPRWLDQHHRPPALSALLHSREAEAFRLLGEAEGEEERVRAAAALAPGADPVFARGVETPPELARLSGVAGERLRALAQAAAGNGQTASVLVLRQRARGLREQLGDSLRAILLQMAARMVARGQLSREDDICFLYFDELWQVWHQAGHPTGASADRLGERKLRYLTSAHQGAPDWMIDQVAYGVRLDQRAHPVLNGVGLVAGDARGPVRRIYSGWALGQIEAGDIVVLDQAATGWLPWLCLADGLILTTRDPLDPAAAMARALGIPTVVGVDDAMHCLVDGNRVAIDGGSGRVEALDT